MGRLVFSDPVLRAKLNEITHPAIRCVWQHQLEERARTYPSQSLAVMIPLLFECELESLFPRIWCVGASRATQVHRLRNRGLAEADAAQRLASQMPVEIKMARADLVFWGEGEPATLLRQLDQIPVS